MIPKDCSVPPEVWNRLGTKILPKLLSGSDLKIGLMPRSEGQKTAQREITTALETAFDARRQRIIISQSQVSLLKWSILFMQAVCALVATAMVHSDNRLASIIAMGIFATGVAASMLLILAHDRPFTGEISIRPDALLQVMPEIGTYIRLLTALPKAPARPGPSFIPAASSSRTP